MSPSTRLVVLKNAKPDSGKLKALANVVRALLPGVLLIVAPMDASALKVSDDSISLDAEVVDADPLAVAVALVRGSTSR
jgi:hypothetical protein